MCPISIRGDIIRLLLAKTVALTVIYYAFFSPTLQPESDSRAVAAHILHDNGN